MGEFFPLPEGGISSEPNYIILPSVDATALCCRTWRAKWKAAVRCWWHWLAHARHCHTPRMSTASSPQSAPGSPRALWSPTGHWSTGNWSRCLKAPTSAVQTSSKCPLAALPTTKSPTTHSLWRPTPTNIWLTPFNSLLCSLLAYNF